MAENSMENGSTPDVTPSLTHPFKAYIDGTIDDVVDRKISGGGNGGNMSEIEKRVRALENDIAVIKSNYATKTDISDLKVYFSNELHSQTRWFVGAIFTFFGLLIAAWKLIPDNKDATHAPTPIVRVTPGTGADNAATLPQPPTKQ